MVKGRELVDSFLIYQRNRILFAIVCYCIVKYFLSEKDEGSIEIAEPSGRYKIEISSSKPAAVWRVKYKGHPKPHLEWYDNQDREITMSSSTGKTDKYEVNISNDFTILKIKYLELKDSGFYTLKAYNGLLETEKKFELVVKGSSIETLLKCNSKFENFYYALLERPSVKVGSVFVQKGEMAKFVCDCAGFPPSKITWTYTPCRITPEWPNCELRQRTILV